MRTKQSNARGLGKHWDAFEMPKVTYRIVPDADAAGDKRSAVISVEKQRFDKEGEASLDSLDLFHSLPVSEQGRGREEVDYD